jgi:hypothetical protein
VRMTFRLEHHPLRTITQVSRMPQPAAQPVAVAT